MTVHGITANGAVDCRNDLSKSSQQHCSLELQEFTGRHNNSNVGSRKLIKQYPRIELSIEQLLHPQVSRRLTKLFPFGLE